MSQDHERCSDGATLPSLDALDTAPLSLKRKLKTVIDRGDPYLMLTGSDADAGEGCCPSGEIAGANRLVAAGLLERWSPPAHPGACPTTLYAFADEIRPNAAGAPTFVVNGGLRAAVLKQIGT